MEDLNYAGPSKNIVPPIGSNTNAPEDSATLTGVVTNPLVTLPDLITKLNNLKTYIDGLEKQIELDVNNYVLPIPQDGSNSQLRDAQNVAWPNSLGTPPSYVSYGYYKALKTVDSSASTYIQNSYISAMRDVGGTAGLDYLTILTFMTNEIDLVLGFIEQYVGNVDDSSEHRLLELFDTWVTSAQIHAQTIEQYLKSAQNPRAVLPEEEVKNLSSDQAQQSQAVFKVKLNSLNGEIAAAVSLLQKNFDTYADLFFNKFLGPALKFRLDVSRKVYPTNTVIGQEVWNSTNALNANVTTSIADQLRRIQFFDSQITQIEQLILMRDTYSGYITQVGPMAGPVVASDGTASNQLQVQIDASGTENGPVDSSAFNSSAPVTSATSSDSPTSTAISSSADLPDSVAVDGQRTTASAPAQAAPSADSAETIAQLEEFIKTTVATTEKANTFASPHNALHGREDSTAHTQYVLKTGDAMTGPLDLEGGVAFHRHVVTKDYITTALDIIIAGNGTFLVTLGNLGLNSFQIVSNEGSGTITVGVTRNKSLQGEQNATVLVEPGEVQYFYCDGQGNWWKGSGGSGSSTTINNTTGGVDIIWGTGTATW